MKVKSKNPAHRPPIWGYGVESDRKVVSITLPKFVMEWVVRNHQSFSRYIRKLILGDCARCGGIGREEYRKHGDGDNT